MYDLFFRKHAALGLLILSFGFLYLGFFPRLSQVFAQESITLPLPKTLPGSALYPFKRLWEKVSYKLVFSESSKIEFQKKLVEKRLAELKMLTDNKNYDQIERSAQRFAYQAGVQTDLVAKSSNEQKKLTLDDYENYKKVLARIRDSFEAQSTYWLVSQQDIDTLNILSEKLK